VIELVEDAKRAGAGFRGFLNDVITIPKAYQLYRIMSTFMVNSFIFLEFNALGFF
jgi:hypothetical protein